MGWKELSADYASYHETPGNRVCHAVGIPLIILGLLRFLPGLVLVWPVYWIWDRRIGTGMAAVLAVLWLASKFLSPGLALGLFVLGWAFQAVGHIVFEKRKAAFQKNLVHLLVGPAWILQERFGRPRS